MWIYWFIGGVLTAIIGGAFGYLCGTAAVKKYADEVSDLRDEAVKNRRMLAEFIRDK